MRFDNPETPSGMTECILFAKDNAKYMCVPDANAWNSEWEANILREKVALPSEDSIKEDQKLGRSCKVNCGWHNWNGQWCIKDKNAAIASYTKEQVKGWKVEDCKKKCKQNENCDMVDMRFDNPEYPSPSGMTECTLFAKDNQRDVCVPDDNAWNCEWS